MRYYIEYELLSSNEHLCIFFRKKEDFNNTLLLCTILDKLNKINIVDFGVSYGFENNEH